MSSFQDDDVIEFETPSAAAVTAALEVNAHPEIDDTGDNNQEESPSSSTISQSTESNVSKPQQPENEPESTGEESTTTATTTVDGDIVDETDSILPNKATILTPHDAPNAPQQSQSDLDNIDTETTIDEFGNPIVTQSLRQGPRHSEEHQHTEGDDEDPNHAYFPPYDTHRSPIADQETMGELYEDEMNFDPDPERAASAKARGNKAFASAKYEDALECYAEALLFCPEENITDRVLYHNNKCAAHIMLKQWDDAIFEGHCVLGLDPENIKALTRRAKAYEQTEQFQEAIEDYKMLAGLEPKMKIYKEKETELTKKNEKKFEKQKAEMVDKLKGWGNSFLGLFGMSTDNFQFQQDPNTGSYSVNFNQNPGQPQDQNGPQQQQGGANSFSFTTGGGQ